MKSGVSLSFSIVTPSLGQGRFIGDALASVEAQAPYCVEHLVFDACSTDETLQVLERHSGNGLLRWASEPDQGQSDAINKGFTAAQGDIVGWLNADDYYLPGAFAQVANVFYQHPYLDIVYGEAQFVDEKGYVLRVKRDHKFDFSVLLYTGCYIMSTATFFRRRIVEDGQLLDVSYRVTMDYEYFVRLASLGYRFGFIPRQLASFRWHDSNVSSRFKELRRSERLRVQREYGGLAWLANDSLRVASFDALSRLYQAKRVARRFLESASGARKSQVL